MPGAFGGFPGTIYAYYTTSTKTPSEFLPANSLITAGAFWTVRLIEMDEVDHDLFRTKAFGQAIFVCRFVAQYHDFRGT